MRGAPSGHCLVLDQAELQVRRGIAAGEQERGIATRSEEHTSELQSLMRISYAVFCLQKNSATSSSTAAASSSPSTRSITVLPCPVTSHITPSHIFPFTSRILP